MRRLALGIATKIKMDKVDIKTAIIKRDLTPKCDEIIGPNARDSRKEAPIPTPKIAMDFVLTLSLVTSLNNALNVADIAPAPCKSLPDIKPIIVSL